MGNHRKRIYYNRTQAFDIARVLRSTKPDPDVGVGGKDTANRRWLKDSREQWIKTCHGMFESMIHDNREELQPVRDDLYRVAGVPRRITQ